MSQLEFEKETPSTDLPPGLDPLAGLELTLTGRWTNGGVLELRWAGHDRSINLPQSLWSVLALLVRKAVLSGNDDWSRDFQTTHELRRGLQRHTNLDSPDPVRYVNRLRKRLRERLSDWPDGSSVPVDWARLVDTHETLGYGVPLPAESLELVLLGDDEPPSE